MGLFGKPKKRITSVFERTEDTSAGVVIPASKYNLTQMHQLDLGNPSEVLFVST